MFSIDAQKGQHRFAIVLFTTFSMMVENGSWTYKASMLALTLTLMLNVNRTLCHKNIHTDITDNTLHNVIFKIDISRNHADIKL